ncbi:temptin-like [Crassostrea angulata]|uniref:temptin-like n=1 Tax=Magallana angulata TaxID=2784310 RepID=UPI0022B1EE68|nr:temptin-like [Crassostrea angulata]
MRAVLFVLSVVITPSVRSWPYYDSSIPVDYVPHVCKDETGQIHYYNITSVGHEFCDKPYAERNSFGLAFKTMLENNQAWSTLCADDADNDGRSNGEELGDPSCSWVPCDETNTNCDKLTAVSHPGIPEYSETVGTSAEYVGVCLQSFMCQGYPLPITHV